MFGEEMAEVFADMYYEAGWVGYAVGLSQMGKRDTTKDVSVTTDYTDQVPWGGWSPGDPEAAKKLLGDVDAPGLKNLLDNRYVTIKGIEQTRYTELANILARGAARGDSTATVATAIDRWIGNLPNDPNNPTPEALVRLGTSNPWNEMVARTEIRSATTAASLDSYREGGLEYVEWLTADGGCELCAEYEAMGPVALDEGFGDIDGPPAHPNCLCVVLPVVGQFVEEQSVLELTDEELAEVFDESEPEFIPLDIAPWEQELLDLAEEEKKNPLYQQQLAEQQAQYEAYQAEQKLIETAKAYEQQQSALTSLQENYGEQFATLDVYDQQKMASYLASLQDGASALHESHLTAYEAKDLKEVFDRWQMEALPKYVDTPSTATREEQIRNFAERMFDVHEERLNWKDADYLTQRTGSDYVKQVRSLLESYTSTNDQRYLNNEAVQEALSHAPTFLSEVHRGINVSSIDIDQFRQLKEGDIFPNKENSSSFSTREEVARKFAGVDYSPQTAILLHMEEITGISVAPFSTYKNEYEVVTNSIFRVNRTETRQDGVLHIYATEVRK